jgi:hypothetical protein
MSTRATYRAFLLRLWPTAGGHWRAVLVDPHTGEQQAFATLELCWAHLLHLAHSADLAGSAGQSADLEETDPG